MKIIIFLWIFFVTFLDASEHIELHLKWKHQFQFAGYYMAKEMGFYKEAGLDVSIQEYQQDINNLDAVISKDGVYAIGYPSIVLDRANGADIVLLAAIYQVSPHVLISLESSNIKTIQDFKNKTIMINKDATKTVSFVAMMRANHIGFNDLKRVDPTFSIEPLLNKKVDITTAFLSNEPYALSKKGIKYQIWDPKDYGFDLYDDILYTSKQEVLHHSKRVQKFIDATLKGWKYAFEHKKQTVNIILEKYNSQHRTKEALLYEAKVLQPLAYMKNIPLGNLDLEKIKRILDLYNVLGLVKQKIDYQGFIYQQEKSFLTQKEQNYLEKKKSINVCIDPNWMPFEAFENGKYIGISADFFKIFAQDLPLKIIHTNSWSESLAKVKKDQCDMLSLAAETQKRKEYLEFTQPYIEIPLVLVTKNSMPFINNLELLNGKSIGVTKEYAFVDELKQKYPNIHFIEVENIDSGLKKVASKQLYGYIDTLATIGYKLSKQTQKDLKISAKLDITMHLGIAVSKREPILFSIMQKIVKRVDVNTKEMILNRWLTLNTIEKTDYKLLVEIISVFLVFTTIFLLLYIKEKNLKKESQEKSLLLDALLDTVSEPMFYKRLDGIYENVNSAFAEKILGMKKQELIGKTLYDLKGKVPRRFLDIYVAQDTKIFQEQKNQSYEAQVKLANGEVKDFQIQKNIFRGDDGNMLGYVAVMYDITELKNKERYLEELASKDALTKLYNRRYFREIGVTLLHLAQREKQDFSVIMLDIDNFKQVNDTYGHDVGDLVLQGIATVMQKCARESDIVARFGGEEFILILPKTPKEGAITLAKKVCKNIEETKIVYPNGELFVTVSVGVSSLNIGDDLDAIIKRADNALYIAKENGKNQVRFD